MIKLYADLLRRQALKIRAFFLLTLFLLISISIVEAQQFKDGLLQGSIRVKFVPELVEKAPKLKSVGGVVRMGNVNIDVLNAQNKVNELKRVIPYSEKFDARHRKYGLHQWYEVRFDKSQDVSKIVKAYNHLAEVEMAEPIYEKMIVPYTVGEIRSDNASELKNTTQDIFNDPLLDKQWHYINSGQSGGKPGADINVKDVWQQHAGSSNIIVSIHDQGVDYNHIDLKNNMWVNEAELNGEEGVDDDGNGFEDDIYGYNFGDNKPDILIGYHGTHVAGTVSAENNNGIGVVGIAGGTGNNDGVRLMTLDIFGNFSVSNIAGSFVYAADNGAVISQNSWGFSSPGVYEQLIHDAIDYFIAEAGNYQGSPMKGGVVIFASGNDNSDETYYPNAYEKVLNVSSVDHNDIKAEYSNYHESVNLSAHGGETSYSSHEGVFSTMPEDNYGFLHGTSMACPHVSGVAALIVSKFQGEEFKNTDLVHRLITGTRDIYSIKGNEEFTGMMGVGIIDADLGMKTNEEIAPDDISDLELIGIGQDFASLRWTVPADEDNGQPDKFIVYFSEYPIDENDIAKASKVTIDNASLAGTVFEYELTGLNPTTTYNIVVVSEDRWFIQSGYSNVVSGTTNDGPEVYVSADKLDIGILGVSEQHKGESEFIIGNSGDGLLKWSMEYFHSKSEDTYKINSAMVNTTVYHDNLLGASVSKSEIKSLDIITYEQEADEHNWKTYFDPYMPAYTMGEDDLTVSNSSATRFVVEDEEGFNLTTVEFGLNIMDIDNLLESLVIEVFRGKEITTAQKVLYQEFAPAVEGFHYETIHLNDQIFFNEGDYFWVVIHVPAGPLYPLVIGFEESPEYSDNCLMSFDKGSSWHALEAVISDDRLVWDVGVGALLKPLHKYISITPEKGAVTSNGEQVVKVEVDASELINGYYDAALLIATNESKDTLRRIEVDFEVHEHKPLLKSVDILDFGTVFHGESKLLHMELANRGLGAFVAENEANFDVQISDPQFKIENEVKSPIKGMQSTILSIRYTPDKVGNTSATVTFNDKYGNTYVFNVYGAGVEAAKAVVTPPSNDFTGLTLGDEASGSFTISNEGGFPLKYYVPGFADGTNLGGVSDSLSCKSGYVFTMTEGNKDNPGFVWEDISQTGTPLFDRFVEDSRLNHIPVAMDFIFPFFGEFYDTLYITRRGGLLSFDQESRFNTSPTFYHYEYNHDRYICAWGREINFADNKFNGDVYYQQFPDRLIIQYHNLNQSLTSVDHEYNYNYWDEPISYQIIIYDNGDIDFQYLNLGDYPAIEIELNSYYSLLAIEDYILGDGLYMNGIIHGFQNYNDQSLKKYPPKTGYKYSIKSPGLGVIESVSPAFGTLQVGETVNIDYTMNTSDLFVGDFTERMTIVTNDPFNNPSFHEANINIVDGGTADIELSTTELDFGEVFQRDMVSLDVLIRNIGKAKVDFVSVNSQNGYYSVEGYMPVVLKPRNKSNYTITILSDEMGMKNDVITFTDSEGNTYTVNITGEVIEAPVITSDPTSFNEAQGYGSTQIKPLSIINTGLSPMEFSVSGEEWLSVYPIGQSSYSKDVGYEVDKLVDKETKLFNWEDISSIGDTLDYTGDIFTAEVYWETVELPFKFSFYGEEYDTLYVGYNGVVSFTGDQDEFAWGYAEFAPAEGGLTNYIAPFFGFISMSDRRYFPNTNVYVHGNEERVIIQYHDYINAFGMGDPMSFQVVLFRNGTFKFMYDFYTEDAWMTSEWGSIGFENHDGTEGKQITYRQLGLEDGTIYTITPKEKYSLAASSTAEFDVIFDSRTLFDGDYTGHIHINNNTPDAPEYKVPVDFTIQGTAEYTIEGSLELDSLMIIPEEGDYRTYDQLFTFHNSGTKDITLNAARLMSAGSYGGAIYADDSKYGTGTAEDGWFNVSRRPLNSTLRPQQSEKLNLRLRPTVEGFYRDTLLIYSDMTEVIKIPIEVTYYGAPEISISNDDMYVYANADTEEAIRNITISNANGLTNLHYSINMDYKREVTTESYSMSTSESTLKSQGTKGDVQTLMGKDVVNTDLKSTKAQSGEYNRILSYTDKREIDGQIGYNSNGTFHAVVGYTAPSDGFNLTHVQTHYAWFDLLQSDLTVQIRRGSEILEETSVVYSQGFKHVAEEESEDGELITIELDDSQLIYPNERFFIVIKYPQLVPFPQGYVFIDEVLENTFYHGNGVEFAETRLSSGFEKAANLIIACEDEYKLSGWAQPDVEANGIIARGEELVIPVTYIADQAEQGLNQAMFIIETNDPKALISEVPLTLERNKGPQIQGELEKELTIYEGLEHQIEIHAVDDEGDAFEFALDANFDFVSTELVNGKYQIKLLPGYEDEGYYSMKVIMTDSFDNTTWTRFDINVVHVNRAPSMQQEIADQYFVLEEEEAYQIDFSDYIVDEDGDVVNFSINYDDKSVVKVFQSGSSIMIHPLEIGKFNLIITATDPYFATYNKTVKCRIDHRTGISGAGLTKVKIYPNPVKSEMYIHCSEQQSELSHIRIISMGGNLIKEIETGDASVNTALKVNLAELTPGIYFVELVSDNDTLVQKFVKE